MCGIAGILAGRGDAAEHAAAVRRMADAMVHRGPDDAGTESIELAGADPMRLPANGSAMFGPPLPGAVGVVYMANELRAGPIWPGPLRLAGPAAAGIAAMDLFE